MKAAEREELRRRVNEEARARNALASTGKPTTYPQRQREQLLRDECSKFLAQGIVDPRLIAKKVLSTKGGEWVVMCMKGSLEIFVADVAHSVIRLARYDERRNNGSAREVRKHVGKVLNPEEKNRITTERLEAETRLYTTFAKQMIELSETFQRDTLAEFLEKLDTPCFVPGGVGWKSKGDLTADECEAVADSYKGRAFSELRTAAEFSNAADAMREGGHETIAALAAAEAAG